jgi:sugar-specific transcriptional regulator TrmB
MVVRHKKPTDVEVIDQVEYLSDEVKNLAINLAIYLAKAKGKSDSLARMEPDFIKLVNGTVRVVQELTSVINAARNMETMAYDVPSGAATGDQLESRLQAILQQCNKIIIALQNDAVGEADG